jgi:hypothetical protein
MLRIALVAAVVAILVVVSGLGPVSSAQRKRGCPAQPTEGDLATQVKTLGEEVQRLSAKVAELEQQRPTLWTAMERSSMCLVGDTDSEQTLFPSPTEPPTSVQQSPVRSLLPWKGDVNLLPSRFAWNRETGLDVLRSYPVGEPLRWDDGTPLFSTRFPWWTPPPQKAGSDAVVNFSYFGSFLR